MSFKAAGLTYVRFSSIASKAMRRGLKPAAAGKSSYNVMSTFGLLFSRCQIESKEYFFMYSIFLLDRFVDDEVDVYKTIVFT